MASERDTASISAPKSYSGPSFSAPRSPRDLSCGRQAVAAALV